MEIKEIEVNIYDETQHHILIVNDDGSMTTMTKAVWDELQAKQTEGGLN